MSDIIMIDAHVHLWEKQDGFVDSRPVYGVGNGLSNFGGEVRQMMPPYMTDNFNSAERLLANMDYASVNAAIVTQEEIDGRQDDYLRRVRMNYPDRFRVCGLYLEGEEFSLDGLDGLKICAGRLKNRNLKNLLPVFKTVEAEGKFISIDMAEGNEQVDDLDYLATECPDLRIAIGHFGMVTVPGWLEQIGLARHKNVYIESGGLTWLFHKEFYPYPSAVKAIREAADLVGMDKLMWGSDYPRTMTDITYSMAVRFLMETPLLEACEKKAFMGGNAMGFYGFSDLKPLPEIPNML